MPSRYFPIKTETACQLKWNWSTIKLYDGTTSSCHRVDGNTITAETFDSFHNTPKKLNDRKLMLQGQWPTGGCEYCKKIEDSGGSSDRLFHLQVPYMSPPELDSNPNEIVVSPRIVEVYFDNVCNMSCIYCWDGFSSKIQQENIKFGKFEKQGVVIENQTTPNTNLTQLTSAFWSWMEKNHQTVRQFHILGGEPFYQRQFEQCLDFLRQYPTPTMRFSIISNLMIDSEKFCNHINRIKKLVEDKCIYKFELTCSIDCFGPEQEYIRYGLEIDQWKKNFEYLVDQEWITLNINQTLTGLAIKSVSELLKYINPLRQHREIGHYFSTPVMTYNFLHPEIFGAHFFDSDFEEILKHMPDKTWQQQEAIKYMSGIKSQLNNSQRNQQAIDQLVIFLSEIDRRRKLDWKTIFPWLKKETHNVV